MSYGSRKAVRRGVRTSTGQGHAASFRSKRHSFVGNIGVDEQEKQIPVIPAEKAEKASAPFNEEVKDTNEGVEDTTMWKSQDKEPEKQIKTDRPGEKPDPLGRKIASLPLNKMKAGYDYALGKGGKRRS